MEKRIDETMKQELAFYEKKIKLAEEEGAARKEESLALCYLEEK
jgi:energy-coupling factor transporter ATP-binding protein EcfA2